MKEPKCFNCSSSPDNLRLVRKEVMEVTRCETCNETNLNIIRNEFNLVLKNKFYICGPCIEMFTQIHKERSHKQIDII